MPKPAAARQRRNKPSVLVLPAPAPRPVPRPPAGLLSTSRRVWRAYWGSAVALVAEAEIDRPRVARWIRALDEYERVQEVVMGARLIRGPDERLVLNPLVAYLADLRAELRSAETDLGLTPLARMRLGITYQQMQEAAERGAKPRPPRPPATGDARDALDVIG